MWQGQMLRNVRLFIRVKLYTAPSLYYTRTGTNVLILVLVKGKIRLASNKSDMQEKRPERLEPMQVAIAHGTDRLTVAQRSALMAKVKSSGTKPEEKVCKALFRAGFRYRKNVAKLPGKPDIVLAKYKAVVFVHGCFWHQHENCPEAVLPQSRQEYWTPKLQRNAERDRASADRLMQAGWRVFIVWECELRPRRFQTTLSALITALQAIAKPPA